MAADEKFPVKVDISASAKFEAKTEIPPESSGRALDALVDIIRPFSEARGLKADQIRLQREDVLLEIAERTKRRLQISGETPNPIPNKFLVPYLEKASLEELGNETLIDAWANLLATASSNYDSSLLTYIDTLGRLSAKEALLLASLCDEDARRIGKHYRESRQFHDYGSHVAKFVRENFCPKTSNEYGPLSKEILSALRFHSGRAVGMLVPCFFARTDGDEVEAWGLFAWTDEYKENQLSFDVLAREGLIKFRTEQFDVRDGRAKVEWVEMTPLGVNFLIACEGNL